MRNKLTEICKLYFTVSLLLIFMSGCGAEKITGSIIGENQNISGEMQAEETSTGAVKEESGSDVTEDTEEMPAYVSIVRITINPQLELYLDAEDKIVDVAYLNKDAEDAFSGLKMKDLSLEDAVRQIVTVSFEEGYLTEGKSITVDFAEQDEKADLPDKMEMIKTVVREELSEKQLAVTLEIEAEGEVQDSLVLEPDEQKAFEETAHSSEQTGNDKASEGTGTQNDKQTDKQTGQQTGKQNGTQEAGNSASAADSAAVQPAGELCPDCGGSGICPECGGGTLPCKRCGGSLWENCGVCGGSGRQNCPGCHGSGKDATSGETCKRCGGAGSTSCEVCGGAGGKSCSICNGKGVVSDDCILCHGGKACTACGGTGVKK
ncbi:MAG: hypothetical protein ACI4AB_01360 [Acetatifactor sp.]